MKKISLLLILLVASISMANAVRPGSFKPIFPNASLVTPDPTVSMLVSSDRIDFSFNADKVKSIYIQNANTGACYSATVKPSSNTVSVPFIRTNGTWEVIALYDNGILGSSYYGKIYIDLPDDNHYPCNWILDGFPNWRIMP